MHQSVFERSMPSDLEPKLEARTGARWVGLGARLRACLRAVGDEREQHGQHHEHDRGAEHPMRHVLVHDPAEQQGADDAADVEAGGDDAKGAAGRAFGIVSTGFNIGGIISPLLFGWIMDQNMPHWVFGTSVVFMVLTVLLALVTDRPQASPQPSAQTNPSGSSASLELRF